MNSILIVLPILTLLMFDLGLSLEFKDFLMVVMRPRAMFAGMLGQLVLLPLLAYLLVLALGLKPAIAIGVMLIACCPGGSSSNVFSKLAGGDVALSVSLTAVSSIIRRYKPTVAKKISSVLSKLAFPLLMNLFLLTYVAVIRLARK